MIKLVHFVKKRKDLTPEQFKDYWLNKHSQVEKLVLEKTKIKKILASFTIGKEPPFDGMVELYFDSMEDLRAPGDPEVLAKLRKDEENFIDLSEKRVFVATEEYLIG